MNLLLKFFKGICYGILGGFIGSIVGATAALIVIITFFVPASLLIDFLSKGYVNIPSYINPANLRGEGFTLLVGIFALTGNLVGLSIGIGKAFEDY